ncbi:MAG TPA: zinc-ribbon domain containing protein [Chloroflexia bacterium]|nr:zinc-ribbon domain containing protein [Chloroflexia bacterium]
MSFEDKVLTCRECGNQFTFTAGEQSFYAEKGLMNAPSRCPSCRASRKANMNGGGGHSRDNAPRNENRVQHPVQCASCGKETTVPFVPKYDRPVYCSECFEQQRVSAGAH